MPDITEIASIDSLQPASQRDRTAATHFDGGLWLLYQANFWKAYKSAAKIGGRDVTAAMHHDSGGPDPLYQVSFWEAYKSAARVLPREITSARVGPTQHVHRAVLPLYQADFWDAVADGQGSALLQKVLDWQSSQADIRSRAGVD